MLVVFSIYGVFRSADHHLFLQPNTGDPRVPENGAQSAARSQQKLFRGGF
jgi:hypothetical protein